MNETKRTLKQKKFIDAYIKNSGNATEAYLAINPKVKRENASVYGIRILEKVSIGIKEFLDKAGLTDIYLVEKLKVGIESDNLNVRLRYLDMAFKLKGKYAISWKEEEGNKIVPLIIRLDKGENFLSKYPKQE